MAKILYEIKEVVEPETLRKIKVYEATTEKLKFLLDIENSTYSEREIGTQTFMSCEGFSSQTEIMNDLSFINKDKYSQTEDLFINEESLFEKNLINYETNLNNNLGETRELLKINFFINLIIFFQIIISLFLFINYQRIKAIIQTI